MGHLPGDITPEPGMDDVYYGCNRRTLLPHIEGLPAAERARLFREGVRQGFVDDPGRHLKRVRIRHQTSGVLR